MSAAVQVLIIAASPAEPAALLAIGSMRAERVETPDDPHAVRPSADARLSPAAQPPPGAAWSHR